MALKFIQYFLSGYFNTKKHVRSKLELLQDQYVMILLEVFRSIFHSYTKIDEFQHYKTK